MHRMSKSEQLISKEQIKAQDTYNHERWIQELEDEIVNVTLENTKEIIKLKRNLEALKNDD